MLRTGLTLLPREVWLPLQTEHQHWANNAAQAHKQRRLQGIRHPVEDFIWDYYPYSPGKLGRWSPGPTVALADVEPDDEVPFGFADADGAYQFTADSLSAGKREHLKTSCGWVLGLQQNTAGRPARFGCFGLHEWAMVMGQSAQERRHSTWPLRVSEAEITATIERVGLGCTHFDAWRFFTPPAVELNPLRPSRATQPDLDQPGCLHANMDLYKWAMRLQPLVPSSFVRRSFDLARRIRTVDMQASPYDFTSMGLIPIPIETPDGRAQFAAYQREFADEAAALRNELIGHIKQGALFL